jgi:hypothetical protein
LRGARVQITALELLAPRTVYTDLAGHYEFAGLVAGRYTVTASMASFIALGYGQARPFEGGKPIVLDGKETRDNVNLNLPRGGAIAGAVFDELGRPLINATVTALRPQFSGGVQQVVSGSTARTNDIGEYRIYGLSPGTFFVAALKSFSVSSVTTVDAESGYAQTYFPGTRNLSTARGVTVKLGQTTAGTNFALDATGTGSVKGSVVNAQGQPVMADVAARLLGSASGAGRIGQTTLSGAGTGDFTVSGLPPGEYELAATIFGPAPPRGGGIPQAALAKLTLNGDNISGLHLTMGPLPAVAGRILLEPSAPSPLSIASIKIGTAPVDPVEPRWYTATVTPNDDLTFTLGAPPGRMLINATLPNGWAMKAVRVNGEDVIDSGVEFRAGDAVKDVEIELTNHPTEIAGTVRGAKNERVDDYTVVVFPRDREHSTGDFRHFATARPDQDGSFAVGALAPGDYYAVALDYVDPGQAQDPELLDRLQRDALPLTIRDGERKVLELKLVTQ